MGKTSARHTYDRCCNIAKIAQYKTQKKEESNTEQNGNDARTPLSFVWCFGPRPNPRFYPSLSFSFSSLGISTVSVLHSLLHTSPSPSFSLFRFLPPFYFYSQPTRSKSQLTVIVWFLFYSPSSSSSLSSGPARLLLLLGRAEQRATVESIPQRQPNGVRGAAHTSQTFPSLVRWSAPPHQAP